MINPLNILGSLFKSPNKKEIDRISKIVKNINSFESEISKLSESE